MLENGMIVGRERHDPQCMDREEERINTLVYELEEMEHKLLLIEDNYEAVRDIIEKLPYITLRTKETLFAEFEHAIEAHKDTIQTYQDIIDEKEMSA